MVPIGVDVGTDESDAYRAVSIWVPIGVDVGTDESDAYRAVSIWVSTGVDVGTDESDAYRAVSIWVPIHQLLKHCGNTRKILIQRQQDLADANCTSSTHNLTWDPTCSCFISNVRNLLFGVRRCVCYSG